MPRNHEDYTPLILKTARAHADIEDALQEAWLCYFEADHSFDENSGRYFISYLQEQLRWHFKKLIRAKHKRRRLYDNLLHNPATPDNATDRAARQLLGKKLAPRARTAVRLLACGYSINEAAHIMKIRPQTITSLLRRATGTYAAE